MEALGAGATATDGAAEGLGITAAGMAGARAASWVGCATGRGKGRLWALACGAAWPGMPEPAADAFATGVGKATAGGAGLAVSRSAGVILGAGGGAGATGSPGLGDLAGLPAPGLSLVAAAACGLGGQSENICARAPAGNPSANATRTIAGSSAWASHRPRPAVAACGMHSPGNGPGPGFKSLSPADASHRWPVWA